MLTLGVCGIRREEWKGVVMVGDQSRSRFREYPTKGLIMSHPIMSFA